MVKLKNLCKNSWVHIYPQRRHEIPRGHKCQSPLDSSRENSDIARDSRARTFGSRTSAYARSRADCLNPDVLRIKGEKEEATLRKKKKNMHPATSLRGDSNPLLLATQRIIIRCLTARLRRLRFVCFASCNSDNIGSRGYCIRE
jgi:hypothetical protein